MPARTKKPPAPKRSASGKTTPKALANDAGAPAAEAGPFRQPEYVFAVLALVFGLAMAFVNPPFQAPDESTHWWRALHISYGHVIARDQDLFPDSFVETGMRFHRDLRLLVGPDGRLKKEHILSLLGAPIRPERSHTFVLRSANIYTPVPYLSQEPGLFLGRALDFSPIAISYLGRVSNLLVWIAAMFLAIRITPVFKWVFVLLGLMPMTLHQAASLSPDAFAFATAFLLTAYVFKLAFEPLRPHDGAPHIITVYTASLLTVLAVVAVLSKTNLALAFIVLLIPTARFGSLRRRMAFIAIPILASALLLWGWNRLNWTNVELFRTSQLTVTIDMQQNLRWILTNPLGFLRLLASTLAREGASYATQFVGRLGWLNQELPKWLVRAYAGALFIPALVALGDAPRWTKRALLPALFAVSFVSVFAGMYVVNAPRGIDFINGIQGRYLIPPALFFFTSLPVIRISPKSQSLVRVCLVAFITVALSTTVWSTVNRYYTPKVDRLIVNDVCNYADAGGLSPGRTISQSFTIALPERISKADYEGVIAYRLRNTKELTELNRYYVPGEKGTYELRRPLAPDETRRTEQILNSLGLYSISQVDVRLNYLGKGVSRSVEYELRRRQDQRTLETGRLGFLSKEDWYPLAFRRIPVQVGETYEIVLRSPGSEPSQSPVACTSNDDRYSGGELLVNRAVPKLDGRQTQMDMAFRVPVWF